MPNWLLGRSRKCPIEARTIYFFPKYFSMVFAFAGDSTITKVFFTLLALARVFALAFAFSAAKLSLPLGTPKGMQLVFYHNPLELHLQKQIG